MVNYKIGQFENDLEKNKSREWMADQIAEAVPGDRSELRAAGLAGDSLAEWDQIYRPLGFSAKNVTLVERDLEAYTRAEQQARERSWGERPHLYFGDMKDFISDPQTRPHAVWNFDLVQNYGPAHAEILDALFGRPRMFDKEGILIFNSQAKRENRNMQWRLFLLSVLGDYASRNYDDLIRASFNMPTIQRDYDKSEALLDVALRDLYHANEEIFGSHPTGESTSTLRHGIFYDVLVRSRFSQLRGVPRALIDEIVEGIDDEIEPNAGERIFRRIYNNLRRFEIPSEGIDPLAVALLLSFDIGTAEYTLKKRVEKKIDSSDVPDWIKSKSLEAAILSDVSFSPIPKAFRTYRYVSVSGTPMRAHAIPMAQPSFSSDMIESFMKYGEITQLMLESLRQGKTPAERSAHSYLKQRFGEKYTLEDLTKVPRKEVLKFRALKKIGKRMVQRFPVQEAARGMNERFVHLHENMLASLRSRLDYMDVFSSDLKSRSSKGFISFEDSNSIEVAEVQEIPYAIPLKTSKGNLSEGDKEAIKSFADEGFKPRVIWENFFADSEISLPQVAAVYSRHVHAESWAS